MEELKARLDEKSRLVEKKTAATLAAAHELAELRDHSEIKDRKINVLQRKVKEFGLWDGEIRFIFEGCTHNQELNVLQRMVKV